LAKFPGVFSPFYVGLTRAGEVAGTLDVVLERLAQEAEREEVRFYHFGRKDRLPKDIVDKISELEERTKHFDKHHFALALDYGGRNEIMRAFNKVKDKEGEITDEDINGALDTKLFPDVDLIIRTSGEQRTSGMMPWQSVYAEYYFAPVHLPDFTPQQLHYALASYASRDRRIGK